jgi:hypothetical protein
MASQRVPGREAVLLGDGTLRVAETADLRTPTEPFLGLTLELVEMRTRGQRSSGHTDLLPKHA